METLKLGEKAFLENLFKLKPQKRNGYLVFQKYVNGKRYRVKRSRAVMQLHLNRKLNISELVHHKDKNKENDSIENLEILNQEDHVSKHYAGRNNKKPKGWKPANTLRDEVIKRIKHHAKAMIKINYSEISRQLKAEGISVSDFTISKYLRA